MKWVPSDTVSSLLAFEYFRSEDNGATVQLRAVNPTHPLGGLYMPAFQSTQNDPFFASHSDVPNASKVTVWGAANTTTIELNDAISIKNIVAYRDLDLLGQHGYRWREPLYDRCPGGFGRW